MSLQADIQKELRDFTLDVHLETDGGILGLLGASGCGKSMTLKCIAGVERPDRGRIVLNGRTLFDSEKGIDLPPQRRKVGYLFQQYALFPTMTVEQNIRAGAHSQPRERQREITAELLRRFQLEGLEKQLPSRLSGGQQQRVALARIFANEPEILLLDEPFAALDSHLKWHLMQEMLDLLKGFSRPVVLVSHDRREVAQLCENACILTEGRAGARTTVSELFRHPGTVAACQLTGIKNISSASVREDGTVRAHDWGLDFHVPAADADCRFLAVHEASVRRAEEGDENAFSCTVERISQDLDRTELVLKLPNGVRLRARPGSGSSLLACREGSPVTVSISGEEFLLLRE